MKHCIRILLLHIYMRLNIFRATHRPSSGACTYCAWKRPPTTRPTTFHVWKTRGCQCSFRLLMMGGVSPETCWASYKYGIIKFWYVVPSCWIFLYELTLILYSHKLRPLLPNKVQRYSLLISGNCSTCFGWYLHPSSGAHTIVSAASGICHTVTATCRFHGRVG